MITGYGVVSPIGVGKAPFWDSLIQGRSGVRLQQRLADTPWPVKIGADVRDFDGKDYVKPRKSLKVMCREIQLGYSAAMLALTDAGLGEVNAGGTGQVDPERFGVVYGSEMYYCDYHDVLDASRACMVDGHYDDSLWGERATPKLNPLWMLMYLPNMIACHLAISQQALGPNNTLTNGDASSLLALVEAIDVIRRDHADVMIVGGAGSRLSLAPMLYRGTEGLSRCEAPEQASRPFDLGRDGLVNGEGAAAIILERRSHAERRGAKPIASVVGWGRSVESRLDRLAPSGDGLRRAIEESLRRAGLGPQELGHVNAQGVSGVEEDRVEAAAIHDLVGEVPVTAPRSLFGSLGAGSGLVELCASLGSLEHRVVPRTLNYDRPDPACPIQVVREPLEGATPNALVVNQAATGQAVAVVLSGE